MVCLAAAIAVFGAYGMVHSARWEVAVDDLGLIWADGFLRRHKVPFSDIRGLCLLRFGQRKHSIYVINSKTVVIGTRYLNADRLVKMLTKAVGLDMVRTRQLGNENETYWIRRDEDLEYVTGRMVARIRKTRLILSGVVAVVFGGIIAILYLTSAPVTGVDAWYLAALVAMALVMCTWLVVSSARRK